MRALQLAGEELQADTGGAQLLGERRELDAAAEPLVLVPDDRDGGAGRADLPGEGDGFVEPGPGDRAGRYQVDQVQVEPGTGSSSAKNRASTAPQAPHPASLTSAP